MQPDELTKQNNNEELKSLVLKCVDNYAMFFSWAWGQITQDPLVWNWHIGAIANELQYLSHYIINREPPPYEDLLINIPPGMTKSSLCTQAFSPWIWLHDPSFSNVISSCSLDLSKDHLAKMKLIVQSEEFLPFQHYIKKRHGKELIFTKDSERYLVNNFGGVIYCTSTLGTVIGKHFRLVTRDDPMTREQAENKDQCEKVHKFNNETLGTRVKDVMSTPTLTIMQRLGQNDTTGHELQKAKEEGKIVRHLCFPVRVSNAVRPEAAKKFYKDGYLDPVRLGEKAIKKQKLRLGSYGFAGQYEQVPTPEGGNKIKKEWFNICHLKEVPEHGMSPIDLWVDGAYTKNFDNDPTGLMACAYHKEEDRLYIYGALDDWLEMPELLKLIPEYCEAKKVNEEESRIRIEPKASGKSLRQMINSETDYNAVEIDNHLVSEGKPARMAVASPKVESGRVWLVKGAWNEHFINQLCAYPNAPHDEFVDLIGYAVHHYFPKKKKKKLDDTKKKAITKASLGFK